MGTVEGGGASFFGGSDGQVAITEGKVDGEGLSFKVGRAKYRGTCKAEWIDFVKTIDPGAFN